MTSRKKLDNRQTALAVEKRSKMLAAKPKFGIGQNRRLMSQVFTAYTESDIAKADAGSRTYAAVDEVRTQENTAALMVMLCGLVGIPLPME